MTDASKSDAGADDAPADEVASRGAAPTTPARPASGAGVAVDLYRSLVESVQDYAIFALDPHGYILSWNRGAERFKGYRADEAIGQHFSIFYPRELVAEGFPEFELRTAANTGRFEDEGWRVRKGGSRFWANVVITALRDDAGKLIGFAKVTRDLTERREAEEALRKSEESFRLLVEGVKDYAIFLLDPTGRVVTWNEGAERIKGHRPQEIIGKSFSTFYSAEDNAAGKPERDLEIASRLGTFEEEGLRVRGTGEKFWASVLITALRNRAGELIGYAKVTRDLTERRAAEQRALADARRVAAEEAARHASEARSAELAQLAEKLRLQTTELEARSREAEDAQRRADEANRAKSEFLAAMSHELRTPLNAIGGYADLLSMGLTGPVTAGQVEQLARIKRSQEHLLVIINDILNFSRIEAGHLTYVSRAVPLGELLETVLVMVSPQMRMKELRLEKLDCPPEVVAWADLVKVEQILLNLLSNAVKFTEKGGSIRVSCAQLDASRAALRVSDTGSGIPADQIHAIFEPFVQVGRTLTSTREGTGLGLAISRDLARAMHGDIVAESVIGEGSTFTLTLPLPR